MKEPTIKTFINGKVTYDKEGQYFFINTPSGHQQMIAELRGWGHIQHMFENKKGSHIDVKKAEAFQDEIGQFVADAINEKIKSI